MSFILLKMIFHKFGATFALQPFDKCFKKIHQNLGMSCEVPTSLLCRNILWSFEILSSTSILQIWSSRHFCTTTYLNILLKILPSVWGCQEMHIIQLHAKTQWCSLKDLSESTSFPFRSSLMICTATLFYFALVPLIVFLLIVLPTKLLSPGDWTHWSIFSACNVSL